MSGVNVRNLEKIQDKWLLFQRFVTSIVANLVLEHKIGYLTKACQTIFLSWSANSLVNPSSTSKECLIILIG